MNEEAEKTFLQLQKYNLIQHPAGIVVNRGVKNGYWKVFCSWNGMNKG